MDIYEATALGPSLSLLVVVGCTLGLVALAVVTLRRARRRARLAADEAATMDPARPLREGDAVLSGVVEHAADHDVAVRVEVHQHGSEAESSGSWSHSWVEVDRDITVAPFYLVRPDGERVRIEPPPDVDVADDLDGKVLVSRTARVLSAELVPGEQLHARGWLERSAEAVPAANYREVSWGWVLRPARGQMLLSSSPLGEGLRQRARFHRTYGALALGALVLLQLSLVGYYAFAAGHVEVAEVIDRKHVASTDSDGDTVHDYYLTLRLHDGRNEAAEVDADDFAHRGARVATRHHGDSWQLGERPTLSIFHAAFCLFCMIPLSVRYAQRRRTSRPWFRRQLSSSGSGRLEDPAGRPPTAT